jgi:hypothetical protein
MTMTQMTHLDDSPQTFPSKISRVGTLGKMTKMRHKRHAEPNPETGVAHGRVVPRARATGVPPYPGTPRHSQWMAPVAPTLYGSLGVVP